MIVGHVFQESSTALAAMHLEYWYGNIRQADLVDEDPDIPVVCWCGGKRHYLDASHCVVWHLGTWNGVLALPDSDGEGDYED